jgi:hypothetical protein
MTVPHNAVQDGNDKAPAQLKKGTIKRGTSKVKREKLSSIFTHNGELPRTSECASGMRQLEGLTTTDSALKKKPSANQFHQGSPVQAARRAARQTVMPTNVLMFQQEYISIQELYAVLLLLLSLMSLD